VSHESEDSRTTGPQPRIAVVGVGNLLLKDEGVGIHVIKAMQKMPLKDVRELFIIDGGTCPDIFYLLPEEIDKLIVVDAVRGGGEPGTIYRFTPKDITSKRGIVTSVHQLGMWESLTNLEYVGVNPKEIVIIGVEPKEIDWGLEVSQELQRKIPQVIAQVKKEVRR
jgi:hydrogenase maturation protease